MIFVTHVESSNMYSTCFSQICVTDRASSTTAMATASRDSSSGASGTERVDIHSPTAAGGAFSLSLSLSHNLCLSPSCVFCLWCILSFCSLFVLPQCSCWGFVCPLNSHVLQRGWMEKRPQGRSLPIRRRQRHRIRRKVAQRYGAVPKARSVLCALSVTVTRKGFCFVFRAHCCCSMYLRVLSLLSLPLSFSFFGHCCQSFSVAHRSNFVRSR